MRHTWSSYQATVMYGCRLVTTEDLKPWQASDLDPTQSASGFRDTSGTILRHLQSYFYKAKCFHWSHGVLVYPVERLVKFDFFLAPLGLSETWDTGQERVIQCSVAQVSDMRWAWSVLGFWEIGFGIWAHCLSQPWDGQWAWAENW